MSEDKKKETIKTIAEGPLPILANFHVEEKPGVEYYGGEHVYIKINEALIRITIEALVKSSERGHMAGIHIEVNTPELIESFEAQDEAIRSSETKH